MKRKYINNGNINNNKAQGRYRQYKVVDKGKAKVSVLALKSLNGFRKKPLVKMERIDLQPYLNVNNHCPLPSQDSRPTYNINSESYHNLLSTVKFDCKVNVYKDNLAGILDIINVNRVNASIKARLQVINDEYTKFYGDINNSSISTPMKTDSIKPRKSVSFSDKIIVHEIQEYHKCCKCSKIFEEYSKLRAHIRQEHKKKKQYECNYCKKCFVDRSIFKVHIKLHCDMCGLFCKKRSAYLIHRRDVCRVIKRYNCSTCQNTFFRFMDLKDHTYDHTVGAFYICDICKEQCTNPCFLAHHILFLHWKKRPKSLYEVRSLGCDRLYLCNFCEFTSVDKDIIESHVELLPDFSNRVMTGYKDYYFCDQCYKKFDTETDMLQHKWTHFLITTTENSTQNNSNSDAPKASFAMIPKKHKKMKNRRPLIKIKAFKFVTSNNQERKSNNKLKKKLKLKLKLIKKKKNKLQKAMKKKIAVYTPKIFYNIHKDLPLQFKPYIRLDKTFVSKYLEQMKRIEENKKQTQEGKNTQSTDDKIIEQKSTEDKIIEQKSTEDKIIEQMSTEDKIIEQKSTVNKIIEQRSTENKIIHYVDVAALNDTLSSNIIIDESQMLPEDGKAIVDKSSKKTLLSKFQCEICFKYLSSRHCLKRHYREVHERLYKCSSCNNVYPSARDKLLHDCTSADFIQPNHSNIDDFNITDDYMDDVDFEIPAPIVELTEYDNCVPQDIIQSTYGNNNVKNNDSLLRKMISEPLAKTFESHFMQKAGFGNTTQNCELDVSNGYAASTNCSRNISNSLCNRPLNMNNHSMDKILNSNTVKSVNNTIPYLRVAEILPVEFI